MTAALVVLCCLSAYILLAGTQQATGSRNFGQLFGPGDASYRVLAQVSARSGVQVAAQDDSELLNAARPQVSPQPALPAADTQASSSRVKMSSVERVRLRVLGSTEFNGEYGVDPDMTLSVPGLGRVDVSQHTASSLERYISERLSSAMRRELQVSIEIVRSRPFFVMGQISRGGAMEWRPGLNVVQALALAGGVVRARAGGLDPTSATMQLSYALTQLERLRAEKEDIASNRKLSVTRVSTGRGLLSEDQRAMIDEQRAIYENRVASLERDRETALHEVEVASSQLRSLEAQYSLADQAGKDLESLREKRLIPNRQYISQRGELVTMEARLNETRLTIERSNGKADTLLRQIELLKQERLALLSDRIETVEKEVVGLRGQLSDDMGKPRSPNQRSGVKFFLARNLAGDLDVHPLKPFDEVNPGDVVIVVTRAEEDPENISKEELLQRVLEASAQFNSTSDVQQARPR